MKMQLRYLVTILFTAAILFVLAESDTDPVEVLAIQDLYKSLNNPQQLRGWKLEGGDPCGEVWMGISCSGSSIVDLQLRGLKLLGSLGNHLQELHQLKNLDVSFNNLQGEIPYGLPPNATHLNMAYNNLTESIPSSLPLMTSLQSLNLSHNSLSGPLGNVFSGLQIKEMDLSFNNLTGDLPSSFASLMNLTSLYLQNNRFTGSVNYLADLPLADLNIEDNEFSGIIPSQFQSIAHLWIWGNNFQAEAEPWKFLLQVVVGVVVLFTTYTVVCRGATMDGLEEIISDETLLGEGPIGSVYRAKLNDGQVVAVREIPVSFSLHEEQLSEVLQTVSELRHENVVTLISFCLKNGVTLTHEYIAHSSLYNSMRSPWGSSFNQDLVEIAQAGAEEIGQLTLYTALHEPFQPLPWRLRLRIAVGVSRGLAYLHSFGIVHRCIRSTNILVDSEFTSRIADCGLASLWPLLNLRAASERAIRNIGYIAPEHGEPGNSGTEIDIYALGVILLELLTGRKAFDSSRPRPQEELLKWAGLNSVEDIIDENITITAEVASEFREVISRCVEARCSASEALMALTELQERG